MTPEPYSLRLSFQSENTYNNNYLHKDITHEDNSVQINDNDNSNKINEKNNNKLMTFRNQEIIEEITINTDLNSFEKLNERN
jgi:hypothetical protein